MTVQLWFVNERDAPPVTKQPAVHVRRWRVFEAASGNRHLLIILDNGSLRITSSIAGVDLVAGAFITQSGRRYLLLEPPEGRRPQRALLAAYAQQAGVVNAADVSDGLWQLFASNAPEGL